ncbi:MAG: efflux RND transporter permease subunit [Burkholderiaceae bacterium]
MWMTRVSIAQPVFATMVMLAMTVLGLFSYSKLGVDQMPEIEIPVISIQIEYPGASAEAVEREITRRVDEAVSGVEGLKKIYSQAVDGYSSTWIDLNLGTDVASTMQDVRDRIGGLSAALPEGTKPAAIKRVNTENDQPLAFFSLNSDQRGLRELSLIAEQTVARRLRQVPGVAAVQVGGTQPRELRVDLKLDRLISTGVMPQQIIQSIREGNLDSAVGRLSDDVSDLGLRVDGRIQEAYRFGSIPVSSAQGTRLQVSDLAEVYESTEEPNSLARINGKPSISIAIFKQQGGNMVAAGTEVQRVAKLLQDQLPADVKLDLIWAPSDWVKQSIDGLQKTLIEGALLTVVIVFLFLKSWRSTVITALTLPISIISAFIAVNALGFTLNFMTVMALSLCVGLLIDDAIVVRENIVRHLHMGKTHFQAAQEGTEEIGLAVFATTLAICAVFVPIAFLEGVMGAYFYPFGITVAVAVMVSLFVSFTLDPMLSSIWKDTHPDGDNLPRPLRWSVEQVDHFMAWLAKVYNQFIHWGFSEARYGLKGRLRWLSLSPRGVILWGAAGSFVAAIFLIAMAGTEFIPKTDQGYIELRLRLPVGSSLERTNEKVAQVEAVVADLKEVKMISTRIGGGSGGRNEARIGLVLKSRSERARTQFEVESEVRERLKGVAGVEFVLGWDRPIEVAILGSNPDQLKEIAGKLKDKIAAIPGVVDPESSAQPGIPTFAIQVNELAAKEMGITSQGLAQSIRTYVFGSTASYWMAPDGEQVDVRVRLPDQENDRARLEQILELPVGFTSGRQPIRLGAVATVKAVDSPKRIVRQNLLRRETVTANVEGRSAGEVGAEVQKLTKAYQLPEGVRFDIGGDTQEQQEAFGQMIGAMLLAIMFIYFVIASLFRSFIQPIAIMVSLPLSLIGVAIALVSFGSTLNMFSIIGLVMLMGLVTKNSILLVDYANQQRRAGLSVKEALMVAGEVRIRPIIMTSFAMIFGMLPLSLALNEGGELQAPMGQAIIGGVITSTLLTLVVVPVIYTYLDQWTHRKSRTARA